VILKKDLELDGARQPTVVVRPDATIMVSQVRKYLVKHFRLDTLLPPSDLTAEALLLPFNTNAS